ncbi:MAG: EamA family transporter [Luteibacter sp.]|jgi:drug/metabolite transporter (DMT)-like permease|uniref:EamA family transporter n=1 Tax=Rhodanobacteraceae TaxID=1775411 RepID=UPI0005B95852|nr:MULTISPECIES: EamA family transporter [Rhodanobacteraceae]MDQ7998126.1 EamA family transporter [Luteibacter sp.]MDQ8050345.1 EamA family transporter [Luteibacter sp.]MDR6643150.1 drug/metabolite transporter (DMT)-like permease [Luteibacter sp. 1214]SDF89415.1 EamA-like transporter family protein [Dyella sp. 333MFSha]SKC06821.1 EamA-like transporter family protein [Luteibacter sp. 22Crub2.1]
MHGLVLALWIANVVLDTGGQLAFKAAAGDERAGDGLARWKYMLARPWIWTGIGCYVAEFLVWIAFLSLVPLSEGVLLGSINIVAIMIAGRFLFRERLSPLRVTGILLVAAGVAIVGAGS